MNPTEGAEENYCQATYNGWLCTREPDHRGMHVAGYTNLCYAMGDAFWANDSDENISDTVRVDRMRSYAQMCVDEYGHEVYRDNAWTQGVHDACAQMLKVLDGIA